MSTVARAAAGEPGDESLCELEGRQSSASSLLRPRLLPGVGSEMVSDAERGVLPTTIVVWGRVAVRMRRLWSAAPAEASVQVCDGGGFGRASKFAGLEKEVSVLFSGAVGDVAASRPPPIPVTGQHGPLAVPGGCGGARAAVAKSSQGHGPRHARAGPQCHALRQHAAGACLDWPLAAAPRASAVASPQQETGLAQDARTRRRGPWMRLCASLRAAQDQARASSSLV